MNNQIYVDNTLIHPETNSDVVLHNNSNLNSFLNGLVSTDNMPNFMQQFLMSSDYVAANQALKTIPQKFFDHAFNTWTGGSTANIVKEDGYSCMQLDTNSYLRCDAFPFPVNSDFTIAIRFKIPVLSATMTLLSFAPSGAQSPRLTIDVSAAGTFRFAYYNGSSSYNISVSNAISANTWTHVECCHDSATNTRRLFINGVAESATATSSLPNMQLARIGADYQNASKLAGFIDFIHISNCIRHTDNFTPPTTDPSFDDYTISLLLGD